MDEESECDWSPPPEVVLVESEIFQLPSGLPPLDDFVKSELEKEETSSNVDIKTLDEEQVEFIEEKQGVEVIKEEASFAEAKVEETPVEEEVTGITSATDIQPEEDIEIPKVEIKKTPKKQTKKVLEEQDEVENVKIDFGTIEDKDEDECQNELKLQIETSTREFIDRLISKVCEIAEIEDPDEILRMRLNKETICKELDEKLFELDIEQKVRFFLNRKIVDFFRRKKATRPLVDDSPEHIISELRKYREELFMVNKYKKLQEETLHFVETKIAELEHQAKVLEAKASQKTEEFFELVNKVFNVDCSERMEMLIANLMNKMKNMQKEISKVRFILIQRQDTLASLLDKAKKLEDLGNGLRMLDFEHLQTETQALGKKIEERNNELNRLHSRCNADIHALAHLREKQHMIRNTISAQEEAFEELVEEKQSCREYLNKLKLDRASIRRQFQKISFQGGLLDKPELLLDYDTTVDKINVIREKINQTKNEHLLVDTRLKQMLKTLGK